MTQLLLGFLPSLVANAMALQSSGHLVLEPAANQSGHPLSESGPVSGSTFCQCCWQDCTPQSNYTLGFSIKEATREVDPQAFDTAVSAWIVVHTDSPAIKDTQLNLYSPVLYTLQEGLEAEGIVTRIIGSREFEELLEAVKGAVVRGKRPLVITVGHDWMPALGSLLDKLRDIKQAGAYLIQYQTEPAENDFNSDGELFHLAGMLQWAERMNADEIWEYTMAHVENYPQREKGPVIRYVPAGYTQFFDLGVDVNSNRAQTSVMGYLGRNVKKPCVKAYAHVLGRKRLHLEQTVWTLDDLRKYMEMYPLQLNEHRKQSCLPRDDWEDKYQHFESLRMSSLLANKACVISPPSATSDMQIWKDVVTFVEVEDTLTSMQSFADNPKKLQDCRTHAYETYKREFNGWALLNKAGFFKTWRAL